MSTILSAKNHPHAKGIVSVGSRPNVYNKGALVVKSDVGFYAEITNKWLQWMNCPDFSFIGIRL